jgi:peptidoglycan hydrolase-like protein with peptidoglycan-binding domain
MFVRYISVATLILAVYAIAPPAVAQTASSEASTAPSSFGELVTDIQRMLTDLGYRPGPVDGKMGDRTRQAIRRYQSNTGQPVDGHPSPALHRHLRITTGAAAPAASTAGASPGATTEKSERKAAWQGQTVSDSLLRIAPSAASVSKQRLATGTRLEVIRRQGAWLEVRLADSGVEGWVKQVSVRPVSDTASAPSKKKKKSGGFFAGLARGVSRLLGGSSDAPQDQGNVTVGIRGLAPEDLASTIPDPGELDRMESFRADEDQAFRFAAEEKLTVQTVEYLPAAGSAAGTEASGASGRRED